MNHPSTQEHEITIDTSQMEQLQSPEKKKRRRRRRRRSNNGNSSDNSSTTSSDASSSSSSSSSNNKSTTAPAKRNNRRKSRNNKKKGSSNAAPVIEEISQEEKNLFVAMDCEMVGVGYGGYKSALARVCIIDWDGNTLMDVHVKPDEEVTDYRTFVSGITREDLESQDALDFETCRSMVLELLQGKILVGHALKNDLHALNIRHAWYDIRDTAKWEPFMKTRFEDGVLWPRKLKDLAHEKLQRQVQMGGQAHCPHEDALTAMDLYKLVRTKWEKAMAYKYNKTMEIIEMSKQQEQQQQRQVQQPQPQQLVVVEQLAQ